MDGFHKGLRLAGHDYSAPGAYFLTVCTNLKQCILSEIVDGQIHLTPCGRIVETNLHKSIENHPLVQLDSFVIIPNHVHLLINVLEDDLRLMVEKAKQEWQLKLAGQDPPLQSKRLTDQVAASKIIPTMMREFKSRSTREINGRGLHDGNLVWQRNYFDRIIRNERELQAVRQYITTNPLAWDTDEYNK